RLNPDAVLMDLTMRGAGAPSLLGQIKAKENRTFLPVIAFVTAITRDMRHLAVTHGASDIIVKFGDSDEVLHRLNNFLQIRHLQGRLRQENLTLEETVAVRTAALERAHKDLAERMATAVEYRHDEKGDHASRVGALSAQIGKVLGMKEADTEILRVAAGLHDVGNVCVPDPVLLKPGPLDFAEREMMELHAAVGGELLSRGHSALLRMAEEIARTHHERWNGTGYPRGLRHELIPLTGRIVAIADVYDALINDRPYRRAKSHEEALAEIDKLSGVQFDPTVVRAFRNVISDKRRAA
ncbi:MAG TPA: HD domain-containing phosphohydrolase, partial [Fimbriimonadaceae bacterium]|nr:HD domain-containing phosphohydrolase [Fimbriimonadaceae bacterium]